MAGGHQTADTVKAQRQRRADERPAPGSCAVAESLPPGPQAVLALQRAAGNAAVNALMAGRMRFPGDQAVADIDGALRELRRDEPAVDTVEKGLKAAKAAGVPVDLEGVRPPALGARGEDDRLRTRAPCPRRSRCRRRRRCRRSVRSAGPAPRRRAGRRGEARAGAKPAVDGAAGAVGERGRQGAGPAVRRTPCCSRRSGLPAYARRTTRPSPRSPARSRPRPGRSARTRRPRRRPRRPRTRRCRRRVTSGRRPRRPRPTR